MSMGKKNIVTGDAEVTRCVGIPFFSGRGHVNGLVTDRKTLSRSIVAKPSASKEYHKLCVSRCNWHTHVLTPREFDFVFSPQSLGDSEISCSTLAEGWGFAYFMFSNALFW